MVSDIGNGWSLEDFFDTYTTILSFKENSLLGLKSQEDFGRLSIKLGCMIEGGILQKWLQDEIYSSNRTETTLLHHFSFTTLMDIPSSIECICKLLGNQVPDVITYNFAERFCADLWEVIFDETLTVDIPLPATFGDYQSHCTIKEEFRNEILNKYIAFLKRFCYRGYQSILTSALGKYIHRAFEISQEIKSLILLAHKFSHLIAHSIQISGEEGTRRDEILLIFLAFVSRVFTKRPCDVVGKSPEPSIYFILIKEVLKHLIDQSVDTFFTIIEFFLDPQFIFTSVGDSFSYNETPSSAPHNASISHIPPVRRLAFFFFHEVLEHLSVNCHSFYSAYTHLVILLTWQSDPCALNFEECKEWLKDSAEVSKHNSDLVVKKALANLERMRNKYNLQLYSALSQRMLCEFLCVIITSFHLKNFESKNHHRKFSAIYRKPFFIHCVLAGIAKRFQSSESEHVRNASVVGMFLSDFLTNSVNIGADNIKDRFQCFENIKYRADFQRIKGDLTWLMNHVCLLESGKRTLSNKITNSSTKNLIMDEKFVDAHSMEPISNYHESAHAHVPQEKLHKIGSGVLNSSGKSIEAHSDDNVYNDLLGGLDPASRSMNLLKTKSIGQLIIMLGRFERNWSTGYRDSNAVMCFSEEENENEERETRKEASKFHEDGIASLGQYDYILRILLPCKIQFCERSVRYHIRPASAFEIQSSCKPFIEFLLYAPVDLPNTFPCKNSHYFGISKDCNCVTCVRANLASMLTARVPFISIPYVCHAYYERTKYKNSYFPTNQSPHSVSRLLWMIHVLYHSLQKVLSMRIKPLSKEERFEKQELSLRSTKILSVQHPENCSQVPIRRIPRYPPEPKMKDLKSLHTKCFTSSESIDSSIRNISEIKLSNTIPTQTHQINNLYLNNTRSPIPELSNAEPEIHISRGRVVSFCEKVIAHLLPPDEKNYLIAPGSYGEDLVQRYPSLYTNPTLVCLQMETLTYACCELRRDPGERALQAFHSYSFMFLSVEKFFISIAQSTAGGSIQSVKVRFADLRIVFHLLRCAFHLYLTIYCDSRNTKSNKTHFLRNEPSAILCHAKIGVIDPLVLKNKHVPQCLLLQASNICGGESSVLDMRFWSYYVNSVIDEFASTKLSQDMGDTTASKCYQLAEDFRALLKSIQ